MKRTTGLLALTLLLTCGICGCAAPGSREPVCGGWTVASAEAGTLTDTARAALTEALYGLAGAGFEPLCLLGTQNDDGVRYAILCKTWPVVPDPPVGLCVAVVHKPAEGLAVLESRASVDFFSFGKDGQSGMPSLGGYTLNSAPACALSERAQTAFDKAAAAEENVTAEPLCCLGTQVVAGLNYAFICRVTDTDGTVRLELWTVYADLHGGAKVTERKTIQG